MIASQPRGAELNAPALNEQLKEVEHAKRELIASVREAVAAHAETWAKVPAVAWEAAQKDELETVTYAAACGYGLWPVCLDKNGWKADMWVDCNSGELVDSHNPRQSASDDDVMKLLSSKRLHVVDPELVIAKLRRTIEQSFKDVDGYLWMNAIRDAGGVPEDYERVGELPDRMYTGLSSE